MISQNMLQGNLHDKLVEVAADYLGPAGKRFVDRQIRFHLQKKPEDLKPADMGELTEWIKVSIGLLTDDRAIVDDVVHRIRNLTKKM